jgi:hypothetical protein
MSRTLFRLYSSDRSTHYTAIWMKNGKYLEVKNPFITEKKEFESLQAWSEARGFTESAIEITFKQNTTEVKNSKQMMRYYERQLAKEIDKINNKMREIKRMTDRCEAYRETIAKYMKKIEDIQAGLTA